MRLQRFKNILVICDEDSDVSPTLRRALSLAKTNNAKVTLTHTIDASPGDLARMFAALPGTRPAEIPEHVRQYHADRLQGLTETFESAGVPVAAKLLEGTAFLALIRQVIVGGHDLVMKAVQDQGKAARLFTKGYDLFLLRKCPCPVWMIKDTDGTTASNILVAVDPDPQDETRQQLSTTVMEIATSLSAIDKAHLHILNVWRLQEEMALRSGRFTLSEVKLDSILEHERKESRARSDDLIKALPKAREPTTIQHIKGLPGDVIPRYAAEHAIDTIVMGTVGRTGISGLFIGNTAESILNAVNCSVIAVKPPGFISPVATAT